MILAYISSNSNNLADPLPWTGEGELIGVFLLAVLSTCLLSGWLLARRKKAALEAILRGIPEGVIVSDRQNRIRFANPVAWLALGKDGTPTTKKFPMQKELCDISVTPGLGVQAAEVRLADGKVYAVTASELVNGRQRTGSLFFLRDVAGLKELEALKGEFVSTLSHDLRSPLTLMTGYTTMLQTVGQLNEQQMKYVEKISFGVENMARLVNTLLDIGRIDAGVGLQLEQVAVVEIVESVMETLRPLAEEKEIAFRLEMLEGLPRQVEADKVLITQALRNLVENAIKYTPAQGSVTLRAKGLPGALQFDVQDSGIGIPMADRGRLFEKFFRGSHKEARAQKGSGLGLAIVHSIAERHGGKIWVDSTEGKGSTFYLVLPLEQAKND